MKAICELDIGGRDEQQDSCKIFHKTYSTFIVLGDGMGGHKGGAVASKTLIYHSKLAYTLEAGHIVNPEKFFKSIIDNTMRALEAYRTENIDTDPQTTCVLVLIQDNNVYSMHIGDSRVYVLDDNKYHWRTKDHSVVQMLLNLGEITEDEMATHPDQNKLLKSLNSKKSVDGTFKITPLPYGRSMVLVCSDGFWEYISIEEMRRYGFGMDIDKALSQMVSLAKQRGGVDGDNISIAVSLQETKKRIKLISTIGLSLFIILSLVSIKYLPLDFLQNIGVETSVSLNNVTKVPTPKSFAKSLLEDDKEENPKEKKLENNLTKKNNLLNEEKKCQ